MKHWHLLATLVCFGAAGCVSPKWRKLALVQSDLMEKALPFMEACDAHLKKEHPGHYLSQDGDLRIRTK